MGTGGASGEGFGEAFGEAFGDAFGDAFGEAPLLPFPPRRSPFAEERGDAGSGSEISSGGGAGAAAFSAARSLESRSMVFSTRASCEQRFETRRVVSLGMWLGTANALVWTDSAAEKAARQVPATYLLMKELKLGEALGLPRLRRHRMRTAKPDTCLGSRGLFVTQTRV